ncbi:hypothetical protein MX111_05495 [Streptococcus uberis]|uniref:hypothetical protein n=1 Tax=Streptococcus uberis TaxID=1349 RepID=UPI0027DB5F64|nr:hypothetical protein [Streptococcus uberis]MCK1238887.1 hypothetical protein [Streptococcus uberis]
MANYVYQQVICTEDFLKNYLLDYYPLGKTEKMEFPYITFNKLVGVKSLNEYAQNSGAYIYYGYGFSYKKRSDGRIIVKFATRWKYPIRAIQRAVKLDRTVEWYAMEENGIYISKFYYHRGLMEDIALLTDDFDEWSDKMYDFEEKLSDHDHLIWYYLLKNKLKWIPNIDDLELPNNY